MKLILSAMLRLIATAEPLVPKQHLFVFFNFNNYLDSFSSSKLVYAFISLQITGKQYPQWQLQEQAAMSN